ncbi:ABC transporter ATP-binding protein [Nonomuraea sp. NPDC046802]|uniref:ABC transporter ATP-binding protein n=1 Tax=Nonomuraea sp. NPDC046802 TaxID=3154919 RepID=UPI0033D750D2
MTRDNSKQSRRRSATLVLGVAWSADRWRTALAFFVLAAQVVIAALFAYWLKLLIDAIAVSDGRAAVLGTCGVVGSIAGTSVFAYWGSRVLAGLSGRLRYWLNRRILEISANMPTIDLHETPEHLTQLEALRRQQHQLYQAVPRLIELLASVIRMVTMGVLLAGVTPALLALPLFGIPSLLVSPWTGGLFRAGEERTAEPARRAEHLLELTATAGAAKEIRLFRIADELRSRFHAEHRRIRRIHHRLQLRAAAIGVVSRCFFVIGYVGAVALVVSLAVEGRATVGDAVLTATLAGQVLALVTGSAETLQLTMQSLVAAGRLLYVVDLERSVRDSVLATAEPPKALEHGIRLKGVSYHYPGTDHPVLQGVDLWFPAGQTVAIVGDNGAGKSTLVKILAGMYRPSSGAVLFDGIAVGAMDPAQFRRHLSACFQDHARFEFLVRETVGIGDLSALADPSRRDVAVERALDSAGASDLLSGLPSGLDTQLGPRWPGGVDLSGGQWQKLALARAMMRSRPLLLLLDEPASALDAEAEHDLFRRWAVASRQAAARNGGVTVLVSHRLSTVRMADLVVVLDKGRVAEVGTHDDLIRHGGLYAEMYRLQASSYR